MALHPLWHVPYGGGSSWLDKSNYYCPGTDFYTDTSKPTESCLAYNVGCQDSNSVTITTAFVVENLFNQNILSVTTKKFISLPTLCRSDGRKEISKVPLQQYRHRRPLLFPQAQSLSGLRLQQPLRLREPRHQPHRIAACLLGPLPL